MTDKVVVFVTAGSAEEGRRIGRALVEQELAACVNVSSPIRSLYHWKNKIADDEEVLLIIKTSRALFDRVRREVEKRHSYQIPEVLCVPVIDGSPNYLNWLAESITDSAELASPRAKVQRQGPRRRPRPRPVKTRKKGKQRG